MAPVTNAGLQVPAKIVMKGNSTMSLHERFSEIPAPKRDQPKVEPSITARLDIGDFVGGSVNKLSSAQRRRDDVIDSRNNNNNVVNKNGLFMNGGGNSKKHQRGFDSLLDDFEDFEDEEEDDDLIGDNRRRRLAPTMRNRRRGLTTTMMRSREATPMSSRNRVLAHRMNTRPSVQAALRDQNKNLRHRLGAKGRLGYSNRNDSDDGVADNSNYDAMRSTDWRVGDNRRRMGADRRSRTPVRAQLRISPYDDLDTIFRNQRFNGYFRNRIGNRFYGSRGFSRRRFGYQRFNRNFNRFSGMGAGRFFRRRFNGGGFNSGSLRPMRMFQQQQSRQDRKQEISREELDKEIDAYMAKTKLHLDTELDSYMADV